MLSYPLSPDNSAPGRGEALDGPITAARRSFGLGAVSMALRRWRGAGYLPEGVVEDEQAKPLGTARGVCCRSKLGRRIGLPSTWPSSLNCADPEGLAEFWTQALGCR